MNPNKIQHYIGRLVSCGYPPHDAMRTVKSFLKEYSEMELLSFIESLEKDFFKCG